MAWHMVLWVGLSCPGGPLSGLIPAGLRPYLCSGQPRWEVVQNRERAERRVRELGPGTVLLACRGISCRQVPVKWSAVAEIGD